MPYNFYIDYDGTGYVQIYPKSIEPFKITREKDQYFYRLEWGKITIVNDPLNYAVASNAKYILFDALQSQFNTTEVRVKVTSTKLLEKFPDGVIGYFYHSDCTFDFDRRTFTVTPTTYDRYTDLLENWENEVDFNNFTYTPGETITIVAQNPNVREKPILPEKVSYGDGWQEFLYFKKNNLLEDLVRRDYPEKDPEDDRCWALNAWFRDNGQPDMAMFAYPSDSRNYGMHIAKISALDYIKQKYEDEPEGGWLSPLNTEFGHWEISYVGLFYGEHYSAVGNNNVRRLYLEISVSRDEISIPNDENGDPVLPKNSPESWTDRGEDPKNPGSHLYTRIPFSGAYGIKETGGANWDTVFVETNGSTSGYDGAMLADNKVYAYLKSTINYPTGEDGDNVVTVTKSSDLKDFIKYLYNNTCNELTVNPYATKDVYSTFFFNDNESDVPFLIQNPGFNYASKKINYLNNIKVFFKKELKIETDEADNQTRPSDKVAENLTLTTFRDFMDNLNHLFIDKLFWWVDSNLDLHIEHVHYVDTVLRADTYDLASDPIQAPLLTYSRKWSYDKEDQYSEYKFIMVDAGYVDFTNNKIRFGKESSNIRGKDRKKEITIHYITTDVQYCLENPNDLESGIVLLCQDSAGTQIDINGLVSGQKVSNGALSLSNIIMEYGRYDGTTIDGYVNGRAVSYETTSYTKVGIDHTLKGTVLALFYNTYSENPDTGIGVGLMDGGTLDIDKGFTKIKLRYRFLTEALTDQWVMAIQNATDPFEDAQDIIYDINNIDL